MRRPDVLVPPRDRDAGFGVGRLPRRPRSARTLALLEAARQHGIPKLVVAVPATALYGRPAARDLPIKERDARTARRARCRGASDRRPAGHVPRAARRRVHGPRAWRRSTAPANAPTAVWWRPSQRRPLNAVAPHVAGDGRQTRDFVFVDDVVDALVRAGERGERPRRQHRHRDADVGPRPVGSSIAGATAAGPIMAHRPADELLRFAVSPVRARIHLSWSPWTELKSGLAQLR